MRFYGCRHHHDGSWGPCTPFYIKAYVEDCGYSSLDKQYTKELKERFGLPRYPLIPLASWICKKNYGFSFADISPEKCLRGVETPMLFIHGTADTYVPTAMVHEVYAAKDTGVKELCLRLTLPMHAVLRNTRKNIPIMCVDSWSATISSMRSIGSVNGWRICTTSRCL